MSQPLFAPAGSYHEPVILKHPQEACQNYETIGRALVLNEHTSKVGLDQKRKGNSLFGFYEGSSMFRLPPLSSLEKVNDHLWCHLDMEVLWALTVKK